jgi:uncharacterized protein (DUF302 family)
MIINPSGSSYEDTVRFLINAIEDRGLELFARIDHAAGARGVELELAEEEVIVFGSPRSGTPLMQSDPRVGLDLPLRMLVWRQGEEVCLGYHDPRDLSLEYDISLHQPLLEQMATLLAELSAEAAG